MRVLGIETSCDETALAIVEGELWGDVPIKILANNVRSQIELHKEYGGVFPSLAKREHSKALVPLFLQTLADARLLKRSSRHVIEHPLRPELQEIFEREPELFAQFLGEIPTLDQPSFDAIAVTEGPGLEPALWTGINFAKALALVWKLPVIPINHMEGHLIAGTLENGDGESGLIRKPTAFPVLALLVSGGHTEIVLSRSRRQYEIVGETKDDAAGEAFDKVARLLGLPYPGGPEIARVAEAGTAGIYPLPRPMLRSDNFDFSFSGLKTAVRYLVGKLGALSGEMKADIAREFEDAVVEVLVTKTLRAAKLYGARTIVLGGGVSANKKLRETLRRAIEEEGEIAPRDLRTPASFLTTDNALMIAVAALGKNAAQDAVSLVALKASGNLKIGPGVPRI